MTDLVTRCVDPVNAVRTRTSVNRCRSRRVRRTGRLRKYRRRLGTS